jgi:hypothetical protein
MSVDSPQLSQIFPPEVLTLVEENEGDLPIGKTDTFTRFWFFVGTSAATNAPTNTAKDVGVPSTSGPLEKVVLIPDYISFVPQDEDVSPPSVGSDDSSPEEVLHMLFSAPIIDEFREWEDVEAAEKVINDRLIAIQPEALELWTDVTSDATITNLAFQGLAAHLLVPVTGQGPVAFKVDVSSLGELAVRDGNERMGAIANFDENRNLLSIYVSNDDATYVSGDDLWEHAKWHFRCAVFVYDTVASHAAGVHLTVSELTMEACREQLPADHPLRRLLKPHVYQAGVVQTIAGSALAPEGGIFHRLFPFNFDGLVQLFKEGAESAPFDTFPQWLENRGLSNLSDEMYPYGTDGLALYEVCRDYVAGYVDIYFPGESIVSDPAVQAWWQQLDATIPKSRLGTLRTKEQLVDLVAQIIFAVSGLHSHVGALTRYLADPRFIAPKVRAGSELGDIQSTFLMYGLNALTGINQPKLLDDYTHMFLELNKDQAVEVFQNFQDALIALGHEIDVRNESRSMPLRTFHPEVLDSSVSK